MDDYRSIIDIQGLISRLEEVRKDMLSEEHEHATILEEIAPSYRESAANLMHYLTLRKYDLKEVQNDLSALGLSSVGHSERYTLRNVTNILYILHLLNGVDRADIEAKGLTLAMDAPKGRRRLFDHANQLFGPEKRQGHTRIMVTLPSESAGDPEFFRQLMEEEVEIFRINTSHDGPDEWDAMISNLRKAEMVTGHKAKVYMDLAGPKIRTGSLPPTVSKKGNVKPGFILLRENDLLEVVRKEVMGHDAVYGKKDKLKKPARISTTLPEVFDFVREGDRIYFDDGKIGGRVERSDGDKWLVRIVRAAEEGSKLRADKGINLPDSDLDLPPLTDFDLETLPFIARNADMVGYSFVQREKDVAMLQDRLEELGREDIGIILKIETKKAFDHLPGMLFQAMQWPLVGIMVARGDLAVELGWTRIAEVQEEIAWICEAAHIPYVWATQILENQVKTGLATRAEITDAAAAVQAECAMLNKGPYIVKGVRTLRSIDRRMQAHHEKKMGSLRPLQVARRFFQER